MCPLFPLLMAQIQAKRLLKLKYQLPMIFRKKILTLMQCCHSASLQPHPASESRKNYKELFVILVLLRNKIIYLLMPYFETKKNLLSDFLKQENAFSSIFHSNIHQQETKLPLGLLRYFCMVVTPVEASVLVFLSKTTRDVKITFCMFLQSHLKVRDRKNALLPLLKKA